MDPTIIYITPKTPHNSNPRHAYQGINTEGDAFEFIEVPQNHPLRVSLPDSDALPNDGNKDSQRNRQNARSEPSTLGFQLRALIDWKWETASCFLAVGSLLAIIATVYPYNGHPLPQWPYGLSINSLISIYTTIMKAAMYSILAQGTYIHRVMNLVLGPDFIIGLGQLKWTWFGTPRRLDHLESFDDASRGALGAAKLLWVLRGR